MVRKTWAAAAVVLVAIACIGLAACTASQTSSVNAAGKPSDLGEAGDVGASGAASGATPSSTAASGSLEPAGTGELVFIAGIDSERAPYGIEVGDGTCTGFDAALARAVCEKNGWELESYPLVWAQRYDVLKAGSIDCIWSGLPSEGLEGDWTVVGPYMAVDYGIFVKADSGIDDTSGLAGKMVVAEEGCAAWGMFEDPNGQEPLGATFAGGMLQPTEDNLLAFEQLKSGAADAVVCDLATGAAMLASGGGAYKQLPGVLGQGTLSVAFRSGETQLANEVDRALRALYADGTVERICSEYSQYGFDAQNWLMK
jgi:polar amino acid transport system substrate-binding protein